MKRNIRDVLYLSAQSTSYLVAAVIKRLLYATAVVLDPVVAPHPSAILKICRCVRSSSVAPPQCCAVMLLRFISYCATKSRATQHEMTLLFAIIYAM